jgi:hypothetical protein
MNKTASMISMFFLITACVFITACMDSSGTGNTTPQITSVTTAPLTGALYSAGDIVRNSKISPDTAWLVIGYDPAKDSYERAFIYRNADGTWGYRFDNRTEQANRVVMEKLYTEKITNKAPASIPIRQPTIAATTTATSKTTGTVTPTPTSTVSPAGKPTFKNIVPDAGTAGTTISITSLTGTNFRSGATVTLVKADNPNITATNVNVQSPTLISCTFSPPSNATAGAWDVVITNPDGQFVSYANIFSIQGSPQSTTTTPADSQGITSISPTFLSAGRERELTITGTNFQQGFSAKLIKSTNTNSVIEAHFERWDGPTQVLARFNIPTSQTGTYNVIVTNPDGTILRLPNGLEVR